MSKIKLLSENLANQIAAGEVVERPASVVKEFVENSLDAGATRVDVQVEGNGTRLIRVIDNGEGMDGDDVLLCLERHATSKLRSQEDLAAIRSLGFRGEALPSIASVAKLTITSRPQTAVLGTRVEVRFGTLVRVHEMGCPQGTCMEVRDLFGNVPARRKFLKSAKTELSHLEEVVVNYALAQPGLGFGFTVDGRELLNLPAATDTLESRIGRLVGKGGGQQLIPVGSDEGDGKALRVWGYLLPPDSAFAVSARLRLFVNGRAVRDRMLAHAVVEGMHEFLLKGRRPAGAVFVELPAGLVDVNVHPTKQEIRFRDSAEVHGQVVDAVRTAMQSYQDTVRFAVFGAPSVVAVEARQPVAEQEPAGLRQSALPGRATMAEPQVDYPARPRPTGEAIATRRAEPAECRAPVTPAPLPAAAGHPAGAPRPSAPPEASATPAVRLLGQLYNSYILCEVDGGLVAIDQHALQERIIFEELKAGFAARAIVAQNLLFPKLLELAPASRAILQQFGAEIAGLGLDIREFGGDTFVIKAVPAVLAHLDPEEVAQGILAQFGVQVEEGRGKKAVRLEDVLAVMACKAAIKGGQRLQPEEMEHLVNRVLTSPVFSHCPHGRPVLKHFSAEEIRRWFQRT